MAHLAPAEPDFAAVQGNGRPVAPRRDPGRRVERVFVVGAVVSTLFGAFLTTVRLGLEYRDESGETATAAYGGAREDLHPVFDLFRQHVGPDDRWFLALGATSPDDATAVRVSLYANYLLLPAIRVDRPSDATVVLAFRTGLPGGIAVSGVERRGEAVAAEVATR
jgi:hypothetical protein